jgi:pSer/pThr/pTyr-binding forkhead associated (FHA) protein
MITNNTAHSTIEKLFLAITPKLLAVDGPLSGQAFYLDEPIVSIGRLESNTVCLEDPFVSRHHCVIKNDGDEYLIEDLDSANGTFLNGERVHAAALKEGSIVQIGASQFLFKLRDREESTTTTENLLVPKARIAPLSELRSR